MDIKIIGRILTNMKRVLSILICVCTLAALLSVSAQGEADKDRQINKGLLLYVGYWGYSHGKYPVPTDEELSEILEVTDEFILLTTAAYNCYTDPLTGQEKQVLNNDVIDSMTEDWVANPDVLDELKDMYKDYAADMINAGYNISDYVADAGELGNRILKINPDAKLWYSVPSAPQLTALTHLFADSWVQVVDEVKEAVGPEVWEKNVCGFYYSDEDVVTFDYAKFDPSKPEENFNNPDVYSMRQVSDKVHSYDKNLVWIPYSADTNSEIYECLGYVANKTDIFDTILIQPSYFFNEELTDNPQIIKDCVEKQAVVYNNGNIIGGTKTSNTIIGWEMEIDAGDLAADPNAEARYQKYVDTFKDYVGIYPTAYYASIISETMSVLDKIDEFYSYGIPSSSSSESSSIVSSNLSTSSSSSSVSGSGTVSASSSDSGTTSNIGNPETGENFAIIGVAVLAVVSASAVLVARKNK